MSEVKVLVKKDGFCPQCVQAKKLLTNLGIDFEEVYVTPESDIVMKIKEELGFNTLPFILPDGFDNLERVISGFSPDAIRSL